MTNKLIAVFAVLCMAFSNLALAANATAFGQELGVATYEQVKQQLGSKTSLSDAGVTKISGGRWLRGNGNGLGIEGLSKVELYFDGADKLVGVVMILPKENFKATLKTLSAKYKLVVSDVPFVGDAAAAFKQGNSVIILNAPHLSFTMNAMYMTSDFHQALSRQSKEMRAAKEKQQADNF